MANEIGFNAASFIGDGKNMLVQQDTSMEAPKKKSSTKKEKSQASSSKAAPIPVPQTSMSYIQENIPYQVAYNETNKQLDDAILQLDMLGSETIADLQMIRGSKTLKNKYMYINDMTENAVSIINAKLAAIREKNKSINDINNLEIRRIKELKVQASEEDDNIRIANMYHAFVNTPIGMGPGALGPSTQDLMIAGGSPDITRATMGGDQAAWEQSLTPAQNRMVLEAKGAIETVVVYDEATGNRFFDVIDKNTRQSVPNVEKPDDSYIYDLDINLRGGFAKDGNRNMTYPLVVLNSGASSISQY